MALSLANKKFAFVLLGLHLIFLVLFGVFVEYDAGAKYIYKKPENQTVGHAQPEPETNQLSSYYPMFVDVHAMIFVGFGFLMTFLRRYGFSALGVNMMVGTLVIEWSLLVSGFLHLHHGKIQINVTNMLTADFAAAAVLISFGAVLGKASPLQMTIVAIIEVVIFNVNEYIGIKIFKAADIGGSMFVHVFGAYFGMSLARVLYIDDLKGNKKESSVYRSDISSMIGTIFLWIFWPSFNSALATGNDQHRAVINTYLALVACCITVFVVTQLVSQEGKFDMVHVQNATLAGGVAVGTTADMMIHPWGAILLGTLVAPISVVGFKFITPFLADRFKLHDTCGVNNLHGMPGILAAIAGAVAAALATAKEYGTKGLYTQFGARAPVMNSTEWFQLDPRLKVEAGDGRSAGAQAGFQLAALGLTIVISILGGILTGFIVRLPVWGQPKGKDLFDDEPYWETPDDFLDEEAAANGAKPEALLPTDQKDEGESKM